MNVVFFNRDFTGKLEFANAPIQVDRYSWNSKGGPDEATLSMPVIADKWELTKLLRCPVEIYGDDGRLNWYGYINRISIPHGETMVGLGLDEMYNSVDVVYGGVLLGADTDTESVTEYGEKQHLLNLQNSAAAEATQSQAVYLGEHKYARPELSLSGGSNEITIECYGWDKTLDWKYYTDSDETNTENTTQISAIVTDVGQFLNGTIIEDTAGITSNENRDGRGTGGYYITQLLNAGTDNTRPMLSYVDKDRYLHVYERAAEPASTAADYLFRDDGNIITPLGMLVPPERCVVAAWVQVQNVPDTLGGISAMRPFFIESAEYDARADKTTYRPAAAFEQVRLSKYIADVAGVDYDSSRYTGSVIGGGVGTVAGAFAGSYMIFRDTDGSGSVIANSGFTVPDDINTFNLAGTGTYMVIFYLNLNNCSGEGTIYAPVTCPGDAGASYAALEQHANIDAGTPDLSYSHSRFFVSTSGSDQVVGGLSVVVGLSYDDYVAHWMFFKLGD